MNRTEFTFAHNVARELTGSPAYMAPENNPAALKTLRRLQILSQQDLATKIGKSLGAISHWERGVNRPPGKSLVKLSELCSNEDLKKFFMDQAQLEKA